MSARILWKFAIGESWIRRGFLTPLRFLPPLKREGGCRAKGEKRGRGDPFHRAEGRRKGGEGRERVSMCKQGPSRSLPFSPPPPGYCLKICVESRWKGRRSRQFSGPKEKMISDPVRAYLFLCLDCSHENIKWDSFLWEDLGYSLSTCIAHKKGLTAG